MGRNLTDERREAILAAHENNPDDLGPALGALVMNGNIPVETVSLLLAVSPPTVYRWMYGERRPRDIDKIKKVTRLLNALRIAQSAGQLPLQGTSQERTNALVAILSSRTAAKAQ